MFYLSIIIRICLYCTPVGMESWWSELDECPDQGRCSSPPDLVNKTVKKKKLNSFFNKYLLELSSVKMRWVRINSAITNVWVITWLLKVFFRNCSWLRHVFEHYCSWLLQVLWSNCSWLQHCFHNCSRLLQSWSINDRDYCIFFAHNDYCSSLIIISHDCCKFFDQWNVLDAMFTANLLPN